ncbi:MAG: TonB-dependent receptor [Rikenellaceae bacterium]
MKKLALTAIIVLCAAATYAAQLTGINITGHVVDQKKGNHIPYATIAIVGTSMGTAADGTGHFNLKDVENGEYIIEASMMGYSPVQKKIVVDGSNKKIDINFTLNEDVMSLDQVVVSSTRSATLRRNSPNLVSMLSGDLFNTVNAPTLADGLSFQTGVRVENNCQNCGFTQVRINGLEGSYSQIMVDSRPLFSALVGVYGLEQIPANMIDRVEVVRGGGSALYGSSAIGGTINIITKTPEYNSTEFAHNLTSIGMSGALDNSTTVNTSVVSDNQRVGLSLYAQTRSRDGYDANDDGFTEITELESHTFGLRSFLKTSDFSRLSLQFDSSNEYRRGGDNLDLPAHDADVSIAEMVEHQITSGGLNYDLFSHDYKRSFNIFSTLQSTNRDSFYGGGEANMAYGTTSELLWVSGAQLTQEFDKLLFLPSQFIAGVEYNFSDLSDEYLQQDWEPTKQKVNVASLYLQNEWKTDNLGILIGGRVDYNDYISKAIFSPRVNVRYNPSENVNLRATYSTGFRSPQAFDEDLHIEVNQGGFVRHALADDLIEETSQSFSLSADLYHNFGDVKANLLVEGFYTVLDNVFVCTRTYFDEDGNEIVDFDEEEGEYSYAMDVRRNGAIATVKGVTVEGRLAFPNNLQLQAGATYQKSLYSEPEVWSSNAEATEQMLRTPDLYGYFTASYSPAQSLTLALSGTYTGRMYVEHAAGYIEEDTIEHTPDFWDANFKLTYNFTLSQSLRTQLHVGVNNIFNQYQSDFDKDADRDAGYVYGPMLPRSFNCGVKFMF